MSVSDKPPHLHWLDAGRALASLAVVLHHVGAIAQQQHGVNFAGGMFSLGQLRPDFFFVLSGFIITWVHGKNLGSQVEAGAFLRGRFFRLYPLLFILTSIKVVIILILGGWRWKEQALDASTLFSSYLLIPTGQYPALLAAWTMPYEVLFYIVFATTGILGSTRVLIRTAVAWSLGVVAFHGIFPGHAEWLPWRFILSPYHLQIFAGVLTCLYIRQERGWQRGRALLFFSGCLILAGMWEHQALSTLPRIMTRCWWAAAFCALIAGTVLEECRGSLTGKRPPRWLSRLAGSSYSIYLVHGPALVIILDLCSRWHLLESSIKDAMLLACATLAVSAGVLCHFFVEKPLQKWLLLPRPAVNADQT
jgi:exopolysaccharide production protein ExoZ